MLFLLFITIYLLFILIFILLLWSSFVLSCHQLPNTKPKTKIIAGVTTINLCMLIWKKYCFFYKYTIIFFIKFLAMTDHVLSQHQTEDRINTIENLTRPVNDILVHRLVLQVPQDIVVISHQPITSMLQYLFVWFIY